MSCSSWFIADAGIIIDVYPNLRFGKKTENPGSDSPDEGFQY